MGDCKNQLKTRKAVMVPIGYYYALFKLLPNISLFDLLPIDKKDILGQSPYICIKIYQIVSRDHIFNFTGNSRFSNWWMKPVELDYDDLIWKLLN